MWPCDELTTVVNLRCLMCNYCWVAATQQLLLYERDYRHDIDSMPLFRLLVGQKNATFYVYLCRSVGLHYTAQKPLKFGILPYIALTGFYEIISTNIQVAFVSLIWSFSVNRPSWGRFQTDFRLPSWRNYWSHPKTLGGQTMERTCSVTVTSLMGIPLRGS